MREKTTLVSFQLKDDLWIHYNIVSQMIVETETPPDQLASNLPESIMEELFFADKMLELESFNQHLFSQAKNAFSEKKDMHKIQFTGVNIFLWFECNFACPYCYQHQSEYTKTHPDEKQKILSLSKLQKLFELNKSRSKTGLEQIRILGGETFLNTDKNKLFVDQLLKLIHNYFPTVTITFPTNGYEIDKYLEILQKYPQFQYNFSITLGIDKNIHKKTRILKKDRTINTWDKITSNIELINKNLSNSKIVIRYNLDEINEIKLKKEINTWTSKYENIGFRIHPIIEFNNELDLKDSYLNFLIKKYALNDWKSQEIEILEPSIFIPLLRYFSGYKNMQVKQPTFCQAYYLNGKIEIRPPFTIHPCESINIYETKKDGIIQAREKVFSEWTEKIENECLFCPFFRHCVSEMCRLLRSLDNKDCYQNNINLLNRIVKVAMNNISKIN